MAEQKQAAAGGRLILSIRGMDCASCAAAVERILQKQPGVAAAQVNLLAERAYVQLAAGADAAALAPQLCAAIATAGYEAGPAAAGAAETAANLAGPAAAACCAGDHEKAHEHNHSEGQAHEEAAAHDHGAMAKGGKSGYAWGNFWLALILTAPVFLAEMGSHLLMLLGLSDKAEAFAQSPLILWAEFILTTIVLFGPGREFFRKGIKPLLHGYPNMDSLVAIGSFAAWGYSSFILIFGAALHLPLHVYFESAAAIITLILLGRVLEARSRGKAGAAITALAKLAPKTAQIRRNGAAETLAVSAIKIGDEILIRPGEKLPVDGTVLEGESSVNEAMMTGEPFPVAKKRGDKLFAGTVNGGGALVYRADIVGDKTVLAQIQQMVAEAQAAKLPIAALADKITAWFVPAILLVALATFILWLAFSPGHNAGEAIIRAVAVLIIACPCAMGLATPLAVIVGTGRAAALGVLFRRGDALQTLCEAQAVAFDKTGTLTAGKPQLVFFAAAPGQDKAAVRAKISAVEARSGHPIAAAFLSDADYAAAGKIKVANFAAIAGRGVEGEISGERLAVGSAAFMADLGVDISLFQAEAAGRAQQGQSPVYAAANGKIAAMFVVADAVRPNTPAAVTWLQSRGLHIAVLTGDGKAAAAALAGQLHIDDIHAEIKPEDKAAIVKSFQTRGLKTAFVGDGINDAPALSTANVGLAIGTGTDVAIEAADIVLMSGDPAAVVRAYGISKAVLRNIKENLFWAFAYNVIAIPVAAGVLVPFGGFGLSPMLGAIVMTLSDLFVVGNALRLRRFKPAM